MIYDDLVARLVGALERGEIEPSQVEALLRRRKTRPEWLRDKKINVIAQAGPLDGKIVIDSTNQFGGEGWENLGLRTAAEVNAARMPGARYTKAFNTLTAGFQAQAAGRTGPDRVVMFLCGDDEDAKRVVAGLIDDAGFTAVDMGGTADAGPMEAPRRPGAVYGEEWRLPEALEVVAAVRDGRPIPDPRSYPEDSA
jgi:Predicted dinucleotide-binding enzymes